MDYSEKRQKYMEHYPEYLERLVLTNELKTSVKKYTPALWKTIENPSEAAIKSYILLELTQNRYSCREIIRMLRESQNEKNSELAAGLERFNTSPGRKFFNNKVEIEVTPVLPTQIKLPNTVQYSMTKKPRGPALVINNAFDLVQMEAQRFVHIFKELIFEAEDHYRMTAKQMIEKFTKLSNDMLERFEEHNERDEALIIMVITHGEDDNLLGINHPSCGGTDDTDLVSFHKIVDLFAKIENTIKIFFFTCCRKNEQRNPKEKVCHLKNGSDTNTDTYVYYSCAEGYETPCDIWDYYYTPYGKFLSESFAQYAHSEDLVQIINRTNQALRDYQQKNKTILKVMGLPAEVGDHAPEHNQKSTTHKVYFNPGWFEGKKFVVK